MELGLLMFPNPTGSADMARMAEGLGFRSLVFADTQCLTPEVRIKVVVPDVMSKTRGGLSSECP